MNSLCIRYEIAAHPRQARSPIASLETRSQTASLIPHIFEKQMRLRASRENRRSAHEHSQSQKNHRCVADLSDKNRTRRHFHLIGDVTEASRYVIVERPLLLAIASISNNSLTPHFRRVNEHSSHQQVDGYRCPWILATRRSHKCVVSLGYRTSDEGRSGVMKGEWATGTLTHWVKA
ncbi:hypothetical protein EVAR_88526_1 [Eumeta japonica]|uniref:Uncharacterized protein n=1 Tax=Eumeta variegata TaxID=151549 RepID=A0A4C1WMU8_EUMVA|nr:hypothetical protein EVAR_88526_1 [Eumeta japonica]